MKLLAYKPIFYSILLSTLYLFSSCSFEKPTTIVEGLNINYNTLLNNLCSISPLLISEGLASTYSISGNSYNPTKKQLIASNCAL